MSHVAQPRGEDGTGPATRSRRAQGPQRGGAGWGGVAATVALHHPLLSGLARVAGRHGSPLYACLHSTAMLGSRLAAGMLRTAAPPHYSFHRTSTRLTSSPSPGSLPCPAWPGCAVLHPGSLSPLQVRLDEGGARCVDGAPRLGCRCSCLPRVRRATSAAAASSGSGRHPLCGRLRTADGHRRAAHSAGARRGPGALAGRTHRCQLVAARGDAILQLSALSSELASAVSQLLASCCGSLSAGALPCQGYQLAAPASCKPSAGSAGQPFFLSSEALCASLAPRISPTLDFSQQAGRPFPQS